MKATLAPPAPAAARETKKMVEGRRVAIAERPFHGEPDHVLVARIRAGDTSALETLYRARYRALWDFAFRYLRVADDAEDVVQDVFTSLWIRHERLEPDLSLDVYLFAAVRNGAIQRVRHGYVERAAEVQRHVQPLAMGAPPPPPDTAVIQRDRSMRVANALSRLSTAQREVLILRWYYGMGYAEIAQILCVTVEAAKQQGSRAQRALRVLLEPALGRTGID